MPRDNGLETDRGIGFVQERMEDAFPFIGCTRIAREGRMTAAFGSSADNSQKKFFSMQEISSRCLTCEQEFLLWITKT
jgi:hypothetical protein